jgi:hypothetical protein
MAGKDEAKRLRRESREAAEMDRFLKRAPGGGPTGVFGMKDLTKRHERRTGTRPVKVRGKP